MTIKTNRTSFYRNLAIAAVLLAAISLGAVLAVAAPALFGGDSYASDVDLRWVASGVLPALEYHELDEYITHEDFADIMTNLFGHTARPHSEGYVGASDAFYAINVAMGRANQLNYALDDMPISFRELSHMLDEVIQIFISHETAINLHGQYLHSTLLINNPNINPYIFVSGVSGHGDIVIAPSRGGRLILDNINISGDIIIANSPHGMDINIINSNAASIRLYGQSDVYLVGNTEIDSIHLYAAGAINTRLLAQDIIPPDVIVNSEYVSLVGNFSYVENNVNNHIIFIDGFVEYFYSSGSVMVLGDAFILDIHAGESAVVQTLNPRVYSTSTALSPEYQELLLAIDNMFALHFGALWGMFYDVYGVTPDFAFGFNPFASGISMPIITDGSGGSTDSGRDGSGSGGNGGIVERPNPNNTPIRQISLDIVAPHTTPMSGVPSGLLDAGSFVQDRLPQSPYFTSAIVWADSNGNLLAGNSFDQHTAYTARITLVARSGRYFPADAIVDATIFGDVRYNITSNVSGARAPGTVVINIAFSPIVLPQAGAFTIGHIDGATSQIQIHTQNLGAIAPENISIRFGSNAQTGTPLQIASISAFDPAGFYTIFLAEQLVPDGRTLFVRILTPLPYHSPYPNYVAITPTVPQNLSLSINEAWAEGFVSILPAMPPNTTNVLLSPTRADGGAAFNYHGFVAAAVSAEVLSNGFILPFDVWPGTYFVYVNFADSQSVEFVGAIVILP